MPRLSRGQRPRQTWSSCEQAEGECGNGAQGETVSEKTVSRGKKRKAIRIFLFMGLAQVAEEWC